MGKTSTLHIPALLLLLFVYNSCKDSQNILEPFESPDITSGVNIPLGFDFSLTHEHAISVIARKSNGFRMGGVIFEVYNKKGGDLISRGITAQDGTLRLGFDLPEDHSSVYLVSPHPAWEEGKDVYMPQEEVESIWEWNLDASDDPTPAEPATTGDGCACPEEGKEILWPVDENTYVIPKGEIHCISETVVRSFNKIEVQGTLYITKNATVKFPGDTFRVRNDAKLVVCSGSGLSLSTKKAELDGEIEIHGWLEDCQTNILTYENLKMGDGAIISHFGNQLFLPEAGIDYIGTGERAYVFFGGLGLNGTLSGTICPVFPEEVQWRIVGNSASFIVPDIVCNSFCSACEALPTLSCGNSSIDAVYETLNQKAEPPKIPENCINGLDDDGDGLVDCEDGECETHASCEVVDSDTDGVEDDWDDFPLNLTLAFSTYSPHEGNAYTYAFESGWPEQGDYDYNDLVVDIRYEFQRNAGGEIQQLIIHGKLRGVGSTEKVAMGISLDDLSLSLVESVSGTQSPSISVTDTGVEPKQNHPVIILFDNAHQLMGVSPGKTVNTGDADGHTVEDKAFTIVVAFRLPLEDVGTLNPFIYTRGKRSREIHLKGFAPTFLADQSFFGIFDDVSVGTNTYTDKQGLPWGLAIPESLKYPKEGVA
ncbi:MAG: LruC domain-containing protein, partial [Bacteroidota bacterium]